LIKVAYPLFCSVVVISPPCQVPYIEP